MSPSVYYNDVDPFCAQWIKNLIKAGHLPVGTVDEQDVRSVRVDNVQAFSICHWFAGIGGWALALSLAGWPPERPIWTASLPCQPFSVAGRRRGAKDSRHLWPIFRRLVAECRPPTVIGEQVASRLGREWLAGVLADLEALGYAVAGADLCAAGVGAPHIRQRLFWVAVAAREQVGRAGQPWEGPVDGVGLSDVQRDADSRCRETSGTEGEVQSTLGQRQRLWLDPWKPSDALPCLDGKARRIEPGSFPLAHGVPARVGRLCAYGNAIVPQIGAAFVRAFLATRSVGP